MKDIKDGMKLFKELVLDNMSCDPVQQQLIACWIISSFVLDDMPHRASMRFFGGNGSGKTTTANLISMLLYGNVQFNTSSMTAEALQNPIAILDSLEEDDLSKASEIFLLVAATGGSLEKRPSCIGSNVPLYEPKSLVLTTGIGEFENTPLSKRTINIRFNRQYRKEDLILSSVMQEIATHREDIITSIKSFVERHIRPHMTTGILHNIDYLNSDYPDMYKPRLKEYFSLLMFIIQHLLRHSYFSGNQYRIYHDWLLGQNRNLNNPAAETPVLDGSQGTPAHNPCVPAADPPKTAQDKYDELTDLVLAREQLSLLVDKYLLDVRPDTSELVDITRLLGRVVDRRIQAAPIEAGG